MSVSKTEIIQMVHDIYAGMLACVDPERKIWYMFNDHRWNRIKNIILYEKIKQDLMPIFLQEKRKLCGIICDDEEIDDGLRDRMKVVNIILKNLNSTRIVSIIIDEMANIFHDKNTDFIKQLDVNINLLGFNNGILNIQTMSFRDGKPDDYISKSTGYNYTGPDSYAIWVNKSAKKQPYDGFIYLLREREFIKTDESVFKFGKTKCPNASRRINSYPKDSEIHYIEKVKDCDQLEKDILDRMCISFRQRTDIGKEYFEGNAEDIIKLIKSSL